MRWFDEILLAARPTKTGAGIRLIALLFGVVFGAGGCATLYFMLLRPALLVSESQSWQPVSAHVTDSHLKPGKSSKGGRTYSIDIRYDYIWNGRVFHGERYNFTKGSTNVGVEMMRRAVKEYPVGKNITVYVDPENPSRSVIRREMPRDSLIGLFFPLPFLAVGICGMSFTFFSGSWYRRSRVLAEDLRSQTQGHGLPLLDATLAEAPARGKSGESTHNAMHFLPGQRWLDRGMLLFLCAFWNGIVAVFLCVVLLESLSGEPPWFLMLFLIPFVLIGAFIFFVLVNQLRQPRPPELLIANRVKTDESGQKTIHLEWLALGWNPPDSLKFRPDCKAANGTWKWKLKFLSASPPEDVVSAPSGAKGSLVIPVPHAPKKLAKWKTDISNLNLEVFWQDRGFEWRKCSLTVISVSSD